MGAAARILLAVPLALVSSVAQAESGRQIFIWFADGGPAPATNPPLCRGTPPPYRCPFGSSTAACRQEVQSWLDRWYADFNITFTYERPTEGVFDTIIMSSEGAWCLADDRTTTYSPLPKCIDAGGGPVVVFKCGDAKACASLIAKEQGHLLGLGHTTGVRDVMNENSTEHDGFEDFQNSVTSAQCSLGQNSYRLMLERLGPWSGGPKPAPREPVVTEVDAGVPPPSIADAEVPPSPEDGMAGTDAADERPNPPKSSGCAVGGGSEPIGGGAAFAVAFVPYWFARRRRRPAPHQVSIKRT